MAENQEATAEATPQANDKLAEALASLTEILPQLRAPAPAPAKQEEKTYTRAQLQSAVDAGTIDDATMAQILEAQSVRKAAEIATKTVRQEQTLAKTAAEVRRYVDAKPDLDKAGTEARKEFDAQYRELVADGYDEDVRTQLLALKMLYKSPEALKPVEEPAPRPTRATSGRSTGRKPETKTDDGPPSWLPDATARAYQRMIDNGQHSGWDDPSVKKQLDFLKRRYVD